MENNEMEVNQELNEAMETEMAQDYPVPYEENAIQPATDDSEGMNPLAVGGVILGLGLGLGYAYKKLKPKIQKKTEEIKTKAKAKKDARIKKYVAENADLEAEIINAKGERMAVEAATEEATDVEITEVESDKK